jgi:S-adenosylmethionine hydrolase
MQHLPATPVIDLTHALQPDHYAGAAYAIERAYTHFPEGTVHLVVFDVFTEREPRLLHYTNGTHHFLFPDNGLMPLVLRQELADCALWYAPAHPAQFHDWIHAAARMAQAILSGTKTFRKGLLTLTAQTKVLPAFPAEPVASVDCQVLYIDHFGNVVLNLTRTDFDRLSGGRAFRLRFFDTEELAELSEVYTDVPEGHRMCRFNSAGYLEIGVRRGHASQLLGLKLHHEKSLLYRHLKITFG